MARSKLTTGFAVVCASFGLVCGSPAGASDLAIYESLSDITIGRVFLSPKQRAYLDSRPVLSPKPVRETPVTAPAERKKDPAGFIISSTGASSVWSQQGFVAVEDASGISFPGDVKVTRKESIESPDLSSTEIREAVSDGKSESADNGG